MSKMIRTVFLLAVAALMPGCAAMLIAGEYKSSSTAMIVRNTDEITGVTFAKPELGERPGAGYYLYYATKDGKKVPPRAVFEVWEDDWLNAHTVIVKADEQMFTIRIPASEWKRNVIAGRFVADVSIPPYCAERADVPLGAERPEVLHAMCSAKRITVRFVGDDSFRTLDSKNPVFLNAVKRVCFDYGPQAIARLASEKLNPVVPASHSGGASPTVAPAANDPMPANVSKVCDAVFVGPGLEDVGANVCPKAVAPTDYDYESVQRARSAVKAAKPRVWRCLEDAA
jgi:hypothetical protein